eukprot:g17408.t1
MGKMGTMKKAVAKKEQVGAENAVAENELRMKGLLSDRAMVAMGGGISGAKRAVLAEAGESADPAVGGFVEGLHESKLSAALSSDEQKKIEDQEVKQRFYAHFTKCERNRLKDMAAAYSACEASIRSSVQTCRAGGKLQPGLYTSLRLLHLYPSLVEDLGAPLKADHEFYKSLAIDSPGMQLINDLTTRTTLMSNEECKLLLRCALGLDRHVPHGKAGAFLESLATTVLIVDQGTDNQVKAAFALLLGGGIFHKILSQYYDEALFLDLVKTKMADPEFAKTWVRGPCAGMRITWILLPHGVSKEKFDEILNAEGEDALAQFTAPIDIICDSTAFGHFLFSKYRAHTQTAEIEATFCTFLHQNILNSKTGLNDLDVRRVHQEAQTLFLGSGSLSSIVTDDFVDADLGGSSGISFVADDPASKLKIMISGAITLRYAHKFNPMFFEMKIGELLNKIDSAPLEGDQSGGGQSVYGLGGSAVSAPLGSLGVGAASSSSATSVSSNVLSASSPALLAVVWGAMELTPLDGDTLGSGKVPIMLMEELVGERMKLQSAARTNESTLWSPLLVLLCQHCRKQKLNNALFTLHLVNKMGSVALNGARMHLLDCVIAGAKNTADELYSHLEAINFQTGLQFLDFAGDFGRYITTIGQLIGAKVPTVSGIDARVREHLSIPIETEAKADQFALALVEAIRDRHNFESQEKMEAEMSELVAQARDASQRTSDFDSRVNTMGRLSPLMGLRHQVAIKKIATQLKDEVTTKHGNLMDVVAKHAPTKRSREAGSVNMFLQRVKRVKEEKKEGSNTLGEEGEDIVQAADQE